MPTRWCPQRSVSVAECSNKNYIRTTMKVTPTPGAHWLSWCRTSIPLAIAKRRLFRLNASQFGFNWRRQSLVRCPEEGLVLVGCCLTSASWWCLRRKGHKQSCYIWPERWTLPPMKLAQVWWRSGRLVLVQVWPGVWDHRWVPWSTAAHDPLHRN